MHRLRHPIRSITEPYGKAGLTVAILALVLATTGAAFAAAGLNSKQKKEVTKIAKKYAGKPGAPGAAGPAGTNGTNGKDGTSGTNGAPGGAGKSVIASAASTTNPGGECPTVGGTKFEVEGSGTPSHVCNGKDGTTGFTETLPSGKTEQGTWAASGATAYYGFIGQALLAPISFVIPLALAPEPIVIGIEEGEGEPNEAAAIENGECTGTVATPGAAEGKLCIFVQASGLTQNLKATFGFVVFDPGSGTPGAANRAGATVFAKPEDETKPLSVAGTWAVTAE